MVYHHFSQYFPTSLCEFCFSVVHSLPLLLRRLRRLLRFHKQLFQTQLCHTQLFHAHTHNTFTYAHTHTTLSHTHRSFTHNMVTHTQLFHTHSVFTYSDSTQDSVAQLTYNIVTQNIVTNNSVTHAPVVDNSVTHTHTHLCRTQLFHTYFFLTTHLSHPTLSHTTLLHTTLSPTTPSLTALSRNPSSTLSFIFPAFPIPSHVTSAWYLEKVDMWGYQILSYGSVSKPCTPVVHIKIAGKWMFIPLKMVLIGIDPYPYNHFGVYRMVKQKFIQLQPSHHHGGFSFSHCGRKGCSVRFRLRCRPALGTQTLKWRYQWIKPLEICYIVFYHRMVHLV